MAKSLNRADAEYHRLLLDIMANGVEKDDRTGTGTKSIFGRQIRFDMQNGFPLLTTKKMFTKGIIVELIWFLRGDTNIKFLVDNGVHIWDGDAYKNYCKHTQENSDRWNKWMRDNGDGTLSMFTKEQFIDKIKTDTEFAHMWGELGPVYGKQWRKWEAYQEVKEVIYDRNEFNRSSFEKVTVDQIAQVIKKLKHNPNDRRMMVTAWNPLEVDSCVLPPCHYGFQLWTREATLEERIQWVMKNTDVEMENLAITEEAHAETTPKRVVSLMWNQRSVDTPLGLPFNIASYAFLLHMIAQQVNMIPGELIGNLGDTHIYNNQMDGVKEQLSRGSKAEQPTLKLNKAQDIYSYQLSDFKIEGYESHPTIDFPLSN